MARVCAEIEAAMVDVDRRMSSHAHLAGLKRLSARANKVPVPATSPRKVCFSFAPFARSVIDSLKKWQVDIAKGLSDEEFVKIEATFSFTFPPDLKAILQEGLPVGLGFPDWRSGSSQQLRMRLNLPFAGISYEVSRGRFWSKQWGPKPLDMEKALQIARAALKKAPILIPVFDHCYIPSSPNLAGNPVFFVRQNDVFVCTYDLVDFFEQKSFSPCSQKPLHRRVSSLEADWCNRNGRSFKIEKCTNSATARRENNMNVGSCRDVESRVDMARQGQTLDWKCEETSSDTEAWGRKLDLLAKRSGRSPKVGEKRAAVHDLDMESPRIFRFYDFYTGSTDDSPTLFHTSVDTDKNTGAERFLGFIKDKNIHERSGSGISLADLTFKSTPATTKTARWIEFWSDLVEKRQGICGGVADLPLDTDMDGSKYLLKEDARSGLSHLLGSCVPQWLARVLEEMAGILRQGGWKEEDVMEAFTVISAPQHTDIFLDRQSMLEELVLHLNLLSNSLRRAGWSVQEISEALDVGISMQDDRRRANRIPSHLSAQITKLAEYVVKS